MLSIARTEGTILPTSSSLFPHDIRLKGSNLAQTPSSRPQRPKFESFRQVCASRLPRSFGSFASLPCGTYVSPPDFRQSFFGNACGSCLCPDLYKGARSTIKESRMRHLGFFFLFISHTSLTHPHRVFDRPLLPAYTHPLALFASFFPLPSHSLNILS